MSVHAAAVVAALLLGAAVLAWPRTRSSSAALADLGPATTMDGRPRSIVGLCGLWHEDPADLYRRWRLRRRPGVLVEDVLELLRGIGPALEAGLAPARAIELAATSTLGAERVALGREAGRREVGHRPGRRAGSRSTLRLKGARPLGPPGEEPSGRDGVAAHVADIDRLVGALFEASERAEPTSRVWGAWAERSASAELAFVAAAWRLSETTGAPLASAVERAVRGLLDARARRGKVAVAVAGPRATVTVLTLLPLTGPLFGLACGVDPAALYLGSPIATVCAAVGLGLVWTGRTWCSRMVRGAVAP